MVKLRNLQVIRGIAALFVCFFHSQYLVDIPNEGKMMEHIRESIGIPLFYIISGFVMVFITSNITSQYYLHAKVFLIKRLIRIVPLFYFSIILFLIVCHNTILNFFTTELPTLLKIVFFIPLFTEEKGPAFGFSFFYVSWSLTYEIFFYFIFTISLLLGKRRYYFLFGYYLFMVIVIPLIFKGYVSGVPEVAYNFNPKYIDFLVNPIQLFFVSGVSFGIIVDRYYKYIVNSNFYLIFSIYIAAVILFLVYAGKLIPSFFGSDLVLCSMFVYVMIIADYRLKINFPRFLTYLGNISFCIYLLHPIMFIYLVGLVRRFELNKLESSWFFIVIGFAVVLVVSAIVHELIEKKCIHYLRQKLLRKGQTASVIEIEGKDAQIIQTFKKVHDPNGS